MASDKLTTTNTNTCKQGVEMLLPNFVKDFIEASNQMAKAMTEEWHSL